MKLVRAYKEASSKVSTYELAKDGIILVFKDHSSYRYTNQSAGREAVAKMKAAAQTGKGLDAAVAAAKDGALCRVR